MKKENKLKELERESFNGTITIPDFRKKVNEYAELYHQEKVKLFAIPVVSNSVCFIPDSIECGFRNRKGECTSLGDCLKANDCITTA